MKDGVQISPVVAGVVIVIVLVIVGFFIYKSTGPRARVEMTPDKVKQMQEIMAKRPPVPGGVPTSMPPGMTTPRR